MVVSKTSDSARRAGLWKDLHGKQGFGSQYLEALTRPSNGNLALHARLRSLSILTGSLGFGV
jgi:hypothetical protein